MGSLRSIRRQDYVPPKEREWLESDRHKNALRVIQDIQDGAPEHFRRRFEVSSIYFLYDGQYIDRAKKRRDDLIDVYERAVNINGMKREDFQDVRAEILYQFRKMLKQWGPLPLKRT